MLKRCANKFPRIYISVMLKISVKVLPEVLWQIHATVERRHCQVAEIKNAQTKHKYKGNNSPILLIY